MGLFHNFLALTRQEQKAILGSFYAMTDSPQRTIPHLTTLLQWYEDGLVGLCLDQAQEHILPVILPQYTSAGQALWNLMGQRPLAPALTEKVTDLVQEFDLTEYTP
ncbi:hypothetical protein HY496_00160 [Candidatus Woesearchaeota archaeon]|nr:hypothetical protein [Candidatus Woesearchaeota archaeon]